MDRAKLRELKKEYGNSLFYQCILRDFLKQEFQHEIQLYAENSVQKEKMINRKGVSNG